MLGGTQLAVALAYTPGETPIVVAKAVGKEATGLLWCAQELGLPLIECSDLTRELVRDLQDNCEIPEWLFRPAAQCIALSQHNGSSVYRVRLLRSDNRNGTSLAARLEKTVEQVIDDLEVAKIFIGTGPEVSLEALEPLLELHRHRLQVDIGVPLFSVRAGLADKVQKDGELEPLGYEIRLAGVREARGKLDSASDFGPLLRDLYGCMARLAWQLLGYRETEALLNALEKRHKGLYQSLFPGRLSVSMLRQILRNLLKEGLSIRDLPRILELLSEAPLTVEDPDQLTEVVRAGFARQLCQQFSDERGIIHAMIVEPSVESQLLTQIHESSAALWLELDLDSSLRLLRSVTKGVEKAQQQGYTPVVLCSPRPRRFLRRLLEPTFPHLPVLSFSEIAPLTEVRTLGTLGL